MQQRHLTKNLDLCIQAGKLPQRVRRIIALAEAVLHPSKVWLFGSRARGTHRPLSDIDLAFDFPVEFQAHWAGFVCDVDDGPYTLLGVDLVNLNRCEDGLLKEILNHGVALYG